MVTEPLIKPGLLTVNVADMETTPSPTHCPDGPQGFHLRDPIDGFCLECGDEEKSFTQGHLELLSREPPACSIVLAEGPVGTAWQRFRSDGSWHSVTTRRATWEALVSRDRPASRIRIVYVPAET